MIISFGELLVDVINEGKILRPFPAGAPANYAVGTTRLGVKTSLIASVGKDIFGDMLVKKMETEGVGTSLIKRSDKKTTLAIVTITHTVPDFFFYRLADADISPEDIDEAIFKDAKWFHFGFLSLTEPMLLKSLFHCLGLAQKHGLAVSCSPNIRPDLWDKSLDAKAHEALGFVDVLFASEGEYSHLFGSKHPENVLREYSPSTLVLTKGAGGCAVYTAESQINVPAFRVEAVDTTGAGDAFAAGFTYSTLNGKPPGEAARIASAVAALSVTRKGAMSALPTLGEVESFLYSR